MNPNRQSIGLDSTGPTNSTSNLRALSRRSFLRHANLLVGTAALGIGAPLKIIADASAIEHTPQNTGSTSTDSLDDYVYAIPAGWTSRRYPDGIVLSSSNGENCHLTLWQMQPPSDSIASDASAIFSEIFKTLRTQRGSTAPSMVRGVSAQGWPYYIIKHGLSAPGDGYVFWGFAFVARLGSQVARISGISKDPLVSSCFGLMMADVWPNFFYSLRFKNWDATQRQSDLSKKIHGVWMSATATAGDRWEFAPNGRFASAAAAQRYFRTSSTEITTVTDAYFGDGAYSVRGHRVTFTYDDHQRRPETGLIRLEQESLDGGRTWSEKLHLLRTSNIDGSEFQVTYEKQ